jgi:hypothetical protein
VYRYAPVDMVDKSLEWAGVEEPVKRVVDVVGLCRLNQVDP